MAQTSTGNIITAARDGNLELIRKIISRDSNRDAINITNPHGWTPLHMAVTHNRIDCVRYLLSNRLIRVNCESHVGDTPLIAACAKASVEPEILKMLLKAKAQVNRVQNENKTALYTLCENLDRRGAHYEWGLEKAKLLLKAGAKINIAEDVNGETAIFAAIDQQAVEMIEILLYSGADVNCRRNYDGVTPLFLATLKDNFDIVELLLPFVVDVDLGDFNDRTPLMIAKNPKIVQLLLDNGACANIIALDTPIRAINFAVSSHNFEKFKLLYPLTNFENLDERDNLFKYFFLSCDDSNCGEEIMNCLNYFLKRQLEWGYFLPSENSHVVSLCFSCWNFSCVTWDKNLENIYMLLQLGVDLKDPDIEWCLFRGLERVVDPLISLWNNENHCKFKKVLQLLVEHDLNFNNISRNQIMTDRLRLFIKSCPLSLIETNLNDFDAQKLLHVFPYVIRYELREFFPKYLAKISPGDIPMDYRNNTCLKGLCRLVIRKNLKWCQTTQQYISAVEKLQIPQDLKNYIRYKIY